MDINQPVPSPDDEEKKQEEQFEEDVDQPGFEGEPAGWQPEDEAGEILPGDENLEIPPEPAPLSEGEEDFLPETSLVGETEAEMPSETAPLSEGEEEMPSEPELLGEVEEETLPEPTPVSEVGEELTAPEEEAAAFPGEEIVPEPPKEESRLARIFRIAVQWTIIGLLMLVTGAGLVYFLVAEPARTELQSVQTELVSLQEQLNQTESELATAQTELAGARDLIKTQETTLLDSSNRIQFLRVMSNLNTARYAIVKKEGATARLALLDAQTELKTILEVVKKADAELATLLDTRLQRAIKNLAGDPAVSEADLNTLIQDMGQLEDLLFPD